MRWAVVEKKTGLVLNVVEWDGVSSWAPPDDCAVVKSEELEIDDIVDLKTGKKTGHAS